MATQNTESPTAAGWYSDPYRRHQLRYWNKREWETVVFDGDRASIDLFGGEGEDGKSSSTAAEGTGKKLGLLGKLGKGAFGWRLDEVVAGLEAKEADTRVDAASRLHLISGPHEWPGLVKVATAYLTDSLLGVRLHALAVVVKWPESRKYLRALLAGSPGTDSAARRVMLDDLGNIAGPDSPFHGKKEIEQALTYSFGAAAPGEERPTGTIFTCALGAAKMKQEALPILLAAKKCNMIPWLYTQWENDTAEYVQRPAAAQNGKFKIGVVPGKWPEFCCVCGAAHPGLTQTLHYKGIHDFQRVGNVVNSTTVKGTIDVPVCGSKECKLSLPEVLGAVGLSFRFGSPEFVAELIYNGHWLVPGEVGEPIVKEAKATPLPWSAEGRVQAAKEKEEHAQARARRREAEVQTRAKNKAKRQEAYQRGVQERAASGQERIAKYNAKYHAGAGVSTGVSTGAVTGTPPAANWYPDPYGRHQLRYWDGQLWRDDVSDNGQASVDPIAQSAPPG